MPNRSRIPSRRTIGGRSRSGSSRRKVSARRQRRSKPPINTRPIGRTHYSTAQHSRVQYRRTRTSGPLIVGCVIAAIILFIGISAAVLILSFAN
jgi:hypothetical protein